MPLCLDNFCIFSTNRFHYDGQAGLKLLTSSDPPTSASQSAGIVFLIEMGFCHVAQVSLQLLTLSDLPASASRSADITGVSIMAGLQHYIFVRFNLFPAKEHHEEQDGSSFIFLSLVGN